MPEALAFGIRLWASVCLALFLAYWLQLDNPFWAGTSAAIVCQPSLGASLRKAGFRLIGTLVGACMLVAIMSAFVQDRIGFILALAAWCGVCGFAATVLQNFASYAASLAGYTAAIIAADAIADPSQAFLLAVARGSEICLGIVCAGVVLTLTGRGTARARAATAIAAIARETGLGMRATLLGAGGELPESATARRALIARTGQLSGLLDETVGESPDLRVRSGTLQAAVDGLFEALSGWRMVATHLEGVAPAQAAAEAAPAIAVLPPGPAMVMAAETSPADTRDRCRLAARAMVAQPAPTPGAAVVLAGAASGLLGLERALNGVALLVEPRHAELRSRGAVQGPPDLLPAMLNGLRSFLIVMVLASLWIGTAWPSGAIAMMFGAIVVLLLSPRGESAVASGWGFMAGTVFTSALAALADFALLPGQEGFVRLAVLLAVFLVPLAALSAGEWHKSFFVAAATNFVPILSPANLPSYDTASFYNETLAIAVGVGVGVGVMALLPQLSPAHATARLCRLTLRDLRWLVRQRRPPSRSGWERLMYARLSALPAATAPLVQGQMVAALYVGEALLRLRHLADRMGGAADVQAILAAMARRQPVQADVALARLDAALMERQPAGVQLTRARAAILALREALARHGQFFGAATAGDALR